MSAVRSGLCVCSLSLCLCLCRSSPVSLVSNISTTRSCKETHHHTALHRITSLVAASQHNLSPLSRSLSSTTHVVVGACGGFFVFAARFFVFSLSPTLVPSVRPPPFLASNPHSPSALASVFTITIRCCCNPPNCHSLTPLTHRPPRNIRVPAGCELWVVQVCRCAGGQQTAVHATSTV